MNIAGLPAHESLGRECAGRIAAMAGQSPFGGSPGATLEGERALPGGFDEPTVHKLQERPRGCGAGYSQPIGK